MNFFLAIIAGGIAGFIAEKLMNSQMGIIKNIILGMLGSIVGGAFLNFFTDFNRESGFFAYIIAGVVGACIIIAIYRFVAGKTARA